MSNMIHILGKQMDIERINYELDIECNHMIQAESVKTSEFGDPQFIATIMIIFEIGKDLFSSGLYDVLKQSLVIIFRNIKPQKEKTEMKIVLGDKTCQISTNFDLTEKQRKNCLLYTSILYKGRNASGGQNRIGCICDRIPKRDID